MGLPERIKTCSKKCIVQMVWECTKVHTSCELIAVCVFSSSNILFPLTLRFIWIYLYLDSSLFITFLMLLKAVQCYNGCKRIFSFFRRCSSHSHISCLHTTIQEHFLSIEWIRIYTHIHMYELFAMALFAIFTWLQPNKWIPISLCFSSLMLDHWFQSQ